MDGTRENHETLVRIAALLTGIRIQYLPNKEQDM